MPHTAQYATPRLRVAAPAVSSGLRDTRPKSLDPRCYERNPGFAGFINRSGLAFQAHTRVQDAGPGRPPGAVPKARRAGMGASADLAGGAGNSRLPRGSGERLELMPLRSASLVHALPILAKADRPQRTAMLSPNRKGPASRAFLSGSDGTRTRDLRRDRPGRTRPAQPAATVDYRWEPGPSCLWAPAVTGSHRLPPGTARVANVWRSCLPSQTTNWGLTSGGASTLLPWRLKRSKAVGGVALSALLFVVLCGFAVLFDVFLDCPRSPVTVPKTYPQTVVLLDSLAGHSPSTLG
jgi:hypothetical protein